MLTRLMSAVITGIEAELIDIEIAISPGAPQIIIVGLPDAVVKESRDRIGAAIRNSGFSMPLRKILINLAPASLKKQGALLELPMALGVLIASGQLEPASDVGFPMVGELGLDGRVLPVRGVLNVALAAREASAETMLVPVENASQAGAAGIRQVLGVATLREAAAALASTERTSFVVEPTADLPDDATLIPDMSDIQGQPIARRCAEIAAVGHHNLLLVGPPGSGKTMLARRLPGVMTRLTETQAIESSKIHGVRGLLEDNQGLLRRPPFRSPHHTASSAAVIGGGSTPMPGEVSLAHHGVLFMDEFPEFSQDVIQALRQPLEDGVVTVPRASMTLEFPARFLLVAAMNPCPCGYATHPKVACTCSPRQIERYRSRLSGPIVDRMDLQVVLPPSDLRELVANQRGESTAEIAERVLQAKHFARQRDPDVSVPNAVLSGDLLKRCCRMEPAVEQLLVQSAERLQMTARGLHKVMRVGRSIADLALRESVNEDDVLEALNYRAALVM